MARSNLLEPDLATRFRNFRRVDDSNGAIGTIFQDIVNIASKKNKSSGSGHSSALAKPESCTLEQFVGERCPCEPRDPRVVICERRNETQIPAGLLQSVYKIRMSDNAIASLDQVAWPHSLATLVLLNNRISHLGRWTFRQAPNLSKLYLSHNQIAHIHAEAFAGLDSLTSLQIESNRLDTFDTRLLEHIPAITKLYLSENRIELPDETRFGRARHLKELLLDHNQISIIRAHWFSNLTSLIWLSLTHNQISSIESNAFDWDYDLEELNLSFNRLKVIQRPIFANSLNIQRLYLGGNPLEPLELDAFRELNQLRSLNLTYVEFAHIIPGTFAYLTQLEFIYFAKFRYCHYATHVRVCRPGTDGLSSVEELLAFPILKYAVWIVASVCSLGNVFVLVWRSISSHEDRSLSLFVRNLSVADLMMGLYLGAIGWQDWQFQRHFGRHAIEWMSSWKCTAIGFLAILSSELSVFILTIITLERYRSIVSIKRLEEEAQKRRARTQILIAWLLSFLIAFYPLVDGLTSSSDYYATNGLCLPLHIDQPFTSGWQYSAFIYLGINFSAVLVIMALYVHMYAMIMDGRQATRPVALFKAEKREDAILAIRFFFIVVTDCLCWIPIVVIKVMALANVSISSAIYGWLVVFIIPINSALNPIVYTLAAPTSLRAAVCRLFERICYRMDAGSGHSEPAARRRRKTGSSSTTTCDTFYTSLVSHSKASVESTLLHRDATRLALHSPAGELQCSPGSSSSNNNSSSSNKNNNIHDDADEQRHGHGGGIISEGRELSLSSPSSSCGDNRSERDESEFISEAKLFAQKCQPAAGWRPDASWRRYDPGTAPLLIVDGLAGTNADQQVAGEAQRKCCAATLSPPVMISFEGLGRRRRASALEPERKPESELELELAELWTGSERRVRSEQQLDLRERRRPTEPAAPSKPRARPRTGPRRCCRPRGRRRARREDFRDELGERLVAPAGSPKHSPAAWEASNSSSNSC